MAADKGVSFKYRLPARLKASKLYPAAGLINPNPPDTNLLGRKIKNLGDVIAHYTLSSLNCDGITVLKGRAGRPDIHASVGKSGGCEISVKIDNDQAAEMKRFAGQHVRFLDHDHGALALPPMEAMKALGVWNPMSGFPVNSHDGLTRWAPFLPLGMGMTAQKAVTLLHYPPYVAMTNADYLHNQTLFRWQMLLKCNEIPKKQIGSYNTFVDVNPVAAPGSGQSEYPNDYLPIMMASLYDQDPSYIRNMLDLLLNPPHNQSNEKYTLPLLVGGSPDYDPQAPGWFRVRYKDQMPLDDRGIPQAVVGQVGTIRLFSNSEKETPYMIVNHMIAAGVQGMCTSNPSSPCDIRMYEAQDLSATMFLKLYSDDPTIDPQKAKSTAFQRWFGNTQGEGPPIPGAQADRLTLCAMAQMDLNFEPKKSDETRFRQAMKRCREGGGRKANPCARGMQRDDKPCCCK